jgi:hypothetical protein
LPSAATGCPWTRSSVEGNVRVYNFEIHDLQSYFVGTVGVVVHNCGKAPARQRKRPPTSIALSAYVSRGEAGQMFIACITFVGPETGGRFTPPRSGFRPQIVVGTVHTSCTVTSLTGDSVFQFDKEHAVALDLLHPEEYKNGLRVGGEVDLYEGSKRIGYGAIVSEEA